MRKKYQEEPIYVSNQDDINNLLQDYPQRQKIRFYCIYCNTENVKLMRHVSNIKDLACPYCKQKNSIHELYSDPNNKIIAKLKREETCLRLYGVKHPLQLDEFKQKQENTCLRNFGVHHISQSPIIKEKIKEHTDYKKRNEITKKHALEKYGVDSVNKLAWKIEKTKQSIKKKYGENIESTSQLEWVKDKQRKTRVAKWGRFLSPNASKTRRKQIYFDNLYFDSTWELCFYIYYNDHNLKIEYHSGDKFEYSINNKVHYYFPDFKIGAFYVEIKGDQFFDVNGNFICPYNRDLDHMFAAKHDCMINNNVRILTGKDMKFYINYVLKNYPDEFIKKYNISKPHI